MLRRVLATIVVVAVAGILLIFGWPQLFGLEHSLVVAQVVALRGLAALCAAVAVLLIGILTIPVRPLRRLGAILCSLLLVFVGANVAVVAGRGLSESMPGLAQSAQPEGAITVLAWNTLGGSASPESVAKLAIDEGADVVSLPETTEKFAVEVANLMKSGGRPMWVHAISFDNEYKAKQTALLTSVDLGTYTIDNSAGNTGQLPTVIARPDDGTGPTLVAAHPVAPVPEYMTQWPIDLKFIAKTCTGNTIVAGDFNSTLDHWTGYADGEGTDLGACTDAARAVGSAGVGTWPSALPALLSAPIDHVVATKQWRATSFRVGTELDDSGSDHRPVIATLVPAG